MTEELRCLDCHHILEHALEVEEWLHRPALVNPDVDDRIVAATCERTGLDHRVDAMWTPPHRDCAKCLRNLPGGDVA